MKASTRGRAPSRPHLRLDLQGLRGLGVILVVFGHLFRTPPGIFSALDMFFVLSGFLITGILIDSHAALGRVYFVPFYLNRVRRVMPMATTVILVTVGLYYLVFSQARGKQVATDGVWAFLSAVNWHFTAEGTNYFSDTSQSPFLHYWSLSVEEQFYLVWPVLLLIGLLVAARSRRPQVVLALVLGAVTVVSFSYSMWHSTASPTAAYFSPFDRAWEFGIGGLIAVGRPLFARLPGWAGVVLGWGGLAGLFLPIFLLRYGDPFPAPWALASVLLTGAVIVGGIGRSTKHLFLLDNRAMVYVGDMSYSVYLWHVPVLLLLRPFITPDTLGYYAAVIAVTAVVSPLSYHLIEKPMRYARWLMTPPERERASRRPRDHTRVRQGWMAVAAAGAALVIAVSVSSHGPAPAPVASTPLPQLAQGAEEGLTLLQQQQRRLGDALRQSTYPALTPPLSRLGASRWLTDQKRVGCATVDAEQLSGCRFGPAGAKRHAVVIGDSVAVAWMPGIRKALEPLGWSVQQLTRLECGTWKLPSYVYDDGTPFPKCTEHHRLFTQYVRREKPDLVILASAGAEVRNSERPGYPDAKTVAYQGLRGTLAELRPAGTRIVVLGAPAGTSDLLDCVTRFGTPEECVTEPGGNSYRHRQGESAAAAQASVRYVDTKNWFCVEARCPAFVGSTPVFVDGAHLSLPFSRQLAPLLRQTLLGPDPAKSTS
jgi:peptidoglycan/LPS O-acetylase OafA/YrhL